MRSRRSKDRPEAVLLADRGKVLGNPGLFVINPPGTVPVGSRRVASKLIDTFEKGQRRPVVGDHLKCRPKRLSGVLPALRPIGGECFGIPVAQRDLGRWERSP